MKPVLITTLLALLLACEAKTERATPPAAKALPPGPGAPPPVPPIVPRDRGRRPARASKQAPRPPTRRRLLPRAQEMKSMLTTLEEASRRLTRNDVAGARHAARVLEQQSRNLARLWRERGSGRGLLLLQSSAALLAKSPNPARMAAVRAACVGCHKAEGLSPPFGRR